MARDDHAPEDLQPLLDRLAAGDAAAADLLIERSVKRMCRLAHHLLEVRFPHVHRWHETGDVVQAAALRLRRALEAVKPASPRDFLNLAGVQIRRELTDLARHEFGPEGPGKHHESEQPVPGADQAGERRGVEGEALGPGPATEAQWRDFLRHVQESLPEEEREVFDLLYVQDLSQEDAARLLGVSVPTVKRRWRAARLRLHEAIRGGLPGT
jgi:RNA polymerase sigma-70 factor (ECF subfamily)